MADIDDPIVREYMNSGDMNMAIASDIAYKHADNLANNPTDVANGKTNVAIEKSLQNHKLIPAYTNEYVTTIKNMLKNEYIMAVRGTNPKNIGDLASDAQILFNQNVNRVDTVEKVYESFRREQPTAKVTLTGHSLGAYVAHTIANKYNEPFVGFDLPASPLAVLSDNLPEFINKVLKDRPFIAPQALNKMVKKQTKIISKKPIELEHDPAHGIFQTQMFNPQVRHRVYFNQGFDAVSVIGKYTNVNDNLKTLPQQESTDKLLGSHSIKNYIYNKKSPSKLVKTSNKKNTYYSMPHLTTAQKIMRSVPRNPGRLRTGYENECLTKPYLKKCKQLNERKFY
jgi:alpha/beta superfamily hydrolase